MAGVFELTQEQTQIALANRRLFSVKCCDKPMKQKEVYSLLPSDKVPFGRSLVVLLCRTCRKEIEVELLTSYPALPEIEQVLGVSK